MPIRSNFAANVRLFHVPIPGTAEDVASLNACWEAYPLLNGRMTALFEGGEIRLEIVRRFPLEAVDDRYWKTLGQIIARTGEPWWDLCSIVVDHAPIAGHPQAHALSLSRVHADGRMTCLMSEEPDEWNARADPAGGCAT